MRLIGFSTGALAYSDFQKALSMLSDKAVNAIELSALRRHELEPLANAIATIDLKQFQYISVHAPSRYASDDEENVVSLLEQFAKNDWPIVLHPDAIHDYNLWKPFGRLLLIENMDLRKSVGKDCKELETVFEHLPDARLCFDIAHARQIDKTMGLAREILDRYSLLIDQVHISDVDKNCRHNSISESAIKDFRMVSGLIPTNAAIIIETIMESVDITAELRSAELSIIEKEISK